LVQVLRSYPRVHGVTCLAEGSDRIFADAVRACWGTYEAVLPVPELSSPSESDRKLRAFLRRASGVTRLTAPGEPEASYQAASREVVMRSDLLIAVWDGTGHGVRGGTAETVAFAEELGKPVRRVWPPRARRLLTADLLVPVG
jgi:hypothetical protein